MKKRIFCMLLAALLVVSIFPVTRVDAAISGATYASKVAAFISDSRWKNGIGWGDNQRPKMSGWSSTGCCAYAADFAAYVYGLSDAWGSSTLKKYTNINDVQAGDIIHISGHWFVVLEKNGSTLKTAEGNFDDKVRITSSGWKISNGKYLNIASGKSVAFEYGYHYPFSDAYTVAFSANDGTGSMSSFSITKDTKLTLPSCGFTRSGYKFAGWMVQRSNDKKYYVQDRGWMTQAEIKSADVLPKIYTDKWSGTFNSSWYSGVSSGVSYTFIATWTPTTPSVIYWHNISGKNLIRPLDAGGEWYSRDTSVYTLSMDPANARVSGEPTLCIKGSAAGSSGHDLRIGTMTNYRFSDDGPGDNESMVLSFWAKSSVNGAKMYFRWGYESTGDYRPVTLTTSWTRVSVRMDRNRFFGPNIHPYIDKAGTFWISEPQLEYGTTLTSYSPADDGRSSGTGTVGAGLTVAPAPSVKGKDFVGWYTKPVGGTRVDTGWTLPSGRYALYGHWTKCPTASFTDVKPTSWFHEAADWAVSNGYISGTTPTTFSATQKANRAMLVTILYRMAGEPSVSYTNPFTDVKPKDYFYNAVMWAAKNGIVSGVSATSFSPKTILTREQAVTILYRYAQSLGVNPSGAVDLSVFPDGNKVSNYAVPAMRWAVANQMISGNAVGGQILLDAKGEANRGQIAIILMKFSTLIQG